MSVTRAQREMIRRELDEPGQRPRTYQGIRLEGPVRLNVLAAEPDPLEDQVLLYAYLNGSDIEVKVKYPDDSTDVIATDA